MIASCTSSPPNPRELAQLRFEERVDKAGACPEVENGVYTRSYIGCVASEHLERAWCECMYSWYMGKQLVVTFTRTLQPVCQGILQQLHRLLSYLQAARHANPLHCTVRANHTR